MLWPLLTIAILTSAPDAGTQSLCAWWGCESPSIDVWPTFATKPLEFSATTLNACAPSPACLVEQVRKLEPATANRGLLVLAGNRATVVGRTDRVYPHGFIDTAARRWLRSVALVADWANIAWSTSSAIVARCWDHDTAASTFGYMLPNCELWDLSRRVSFDLGGGAWSPGSGFVESVKGSSVVVAVVLWGVPSWCRRGLPSSAGRARGPLYLVRATVDLSGKKLQWVGKPSLHRYNGGEGEDIALGRCRSVPPTSGLEK